MCLLSIKSFIWHQDIRGLDVHTDVCVFVLLYSVLQTRRRVLLQLLKFGHGCRLKSVNNDMLTVLLTDEIIIQRDEVPTELII